MALIEMVDADDRSLEHMTREELVSAWRHWFRLTADTEPEGPFEHDVFARVTSEQFAEDSGIDVVNRWRERDGLPPFTAK